MNKKFWLTLPLFVSVLFVLNSNQVIAADSESSDMAIDGALFHIQTFNATAGFNSEVVVIPVGGTSYIGITTQSNQADSGDPLPTTAQTDTGEVMMTTSEWWISQDALALSWEKSDTNPLEVYGCRQVGRHSVVTYNGDTYFGAQCTAGATVFKVVSLNEAELVHTNSLGEVTATDPNDQPPTQTIEATQYPTAAVVHDAVYFFFNGGYSKFDGTTWEDSTNVPAGEENAVPLQISDLNDNGNIYVPLGNRVFEFDGSTYTEIGSLPSDIGGILAATGLYNNSLFVGNADAELGARIYQYDLTKATSEWTSAIQLDAEDMIVNKMVTTNRFNKLNYLVFFTKNTTYGAKIYALDENGETRELTKLSGDHPEYNEDIVSFVNQTVKTNDNPEAEVILFGTQNNQTEAELYGLRVGTDLSVTPTEESIVSAPVTEPSMVLQAVLKLAGGKTNLTAFGEVFKLKVSKNQVQAGDVFTLYVNGQSVDQVKAKSNDKAIILKYKKASKLASGKTFTVQVGRKLSYGTGKEKIIASNAVSGETLKVTVQ